MLDLETLDNGSNAVVLSVGATVFTRDEMIAEKEWHLDVDAQVSQGRRVSFETVRWWLKQTEKAKELFSISHRTSLGFFTGEFCQFVRLHGGPDVIVWGNGAGFDVPIIESLLKKNLGHGNELPWKFWNARCFRTVKSITNCDKLIPFEGEKHGALNDARHQAKCLMELWKLQPEMEK